jgi:hypothetical protein
VHALLLVVVLAGAPHLAQSDLARLRRTIPAQLKGPLAPLSPKLEAARSGTKPSVANVRNRLKEMRELETAARALLANPAIDPQPVHQALALGWGDLAELEGALAIEGEGDELQRDAVRTNARARAEDAEALAASELDSKTARGPAAQVVVRQQSALDACWQEHLLSTSAPVTVERMATVVLEKGRVRAVSFTSPLAGPLAHLGECLQTRILGWQLTDDADALELPLRFTAPNR